jgi:hypothetical protein
LREFYRPYNELLATLTDERGFRWLDGGSLREKQLKAITGVGFKSQNPPENEYQNLQKRKQEAILSHKRIHDKSRHERMDRVASEGLSSMVRLVCL